MKKLKNMDTLQKNRSLGSRDAIIALVLFGVAGLIMFYQNREVYSANWQLAQAQAEAEAVLPKAKQDGAKVEIACERAIKGLLVSPTSAKFPSVFSGQKTTAKFSPYEGRWFYSVPVTADNAFGAGLTTTFNCVVDDETGGITALEPMS